MPGPPAEEDSRPVWSGRNFFAASSVARKGRRRAQTIAAREDGKIGQTGGLYFAASGNGEAGGSA